MTNEESWNALTKNCPSTITSISVPTAHSEDGVVFYDIRVSGSTTWFSAKRYSQFETFYSKLSDVTTIPIPLPPKTNKLTNKVFSPAFVETRRTLLEAFLQRLLNDRKISTTDVFRSFLTSDCKTSALKQTTRKVVLITGGNSGIGFETARQLLATGTMTVIILVRDELKGQQAVAALKSDPAVIRACGKKEAEAKWMLCDVSSLRSVRMFAETFLALNLPLHVLICNAGV